jgi:iron complex transport system substrate-binding protein
VLFVVSTSPIIAAGKGTFMDELLLMAGGENAASSFSGRYPRLSVEDLLAGKPDIIFIAAMAGVEKFSPEVTRWKEIPAFRDGEVVSLDGDMVTRPGPRMVAALEEVSRVLAAWRERRRTAEEGMKRGSR